MPDQLVSLQEQLTQLRGQSENLARELIASASKVAQLQREQVQLRRAGGHDAELERNQQQLKQLESQRRSQLETQTKLEQQVAAGIGAVIGMRPLEESLTFLDGGVPIALLPVRLETRFFNQARELRIRVFPDTIHVDSHQPELTAAEAEQGRNYWTQRLANDPAALAANWGELVKRLGAARASWVVRTMTPQTYDPARDALQPGAALEFPEPALRAEGMARPPRSVALPDRWVAVGLRHRSVGDGFDTLFKCWGGTVPDALQVGPSFDRLASTSDSASEPALNVELRWLSDYEVARQRGMAITVRDADLTAGKRLADGVDLLLVFGVDWTQTPEQSAASLSRLFEAHAYTDGVGFVPQGTATNNTAKKRAGTSGEVEPSAPPDPVRPAAVHPRYGAAARLEAALGLGAPSVLRSVSGAALSEQRTCSLLINALWQSTLGYYLDVLIDPFAKDRLIGLTRDHATTHLQPFGPYAALRIGKQPYGILPVLALDRFDADRDDGIEAALKKLLTLLRWYFTEGLPDVPRMGRSGDPDDDLLELLQQTPVSESARFRRALDTETAANVESQTLKQLAAVQSDILRSLVMPHFSSYAGPTFNAARILRLAVYPNHHAVQDVWTAPASSAADPNALSYIGAIATEAKGGLAGRTALDKRSDTPTALLEALLAHAALREMAAAEAATLDRHQLDRGLIKEPPERAMLRTSASLGIQTQAEESIAGAVYIQTPKQLAAAVVPALTGNASLSDYVSKQLTLPRSAQQPQVRTLAQFSDALQQLASVPQAELDRALRATLDCYSHRYDAWHTSLATRRLDALRSQGKTGLHLGGYGWVTELRPEARPDSLGYVHMPSLNHAATAALLRSGHLSHRGTEASALNIDLSSRRVRNALSVLEGVSAGQPLAALLGYRFERSLRDRGLSFARFILPFRKLAPFRSTMPDLASGPRESIAARDVADGLALIERWRNGEDLLAKLTTTAPDATERSALLASLAELADVLDAYSDVLTSEAAYQTVRGNYERAGAALAALDRQARPPEPQVVRTPRSGTRYIQRVAVVVQDSALPEAWRELAPDLRARLEPRLNNWLARVLGDPNNYVLAAEIRSEATVMATVSATLAELGLSALSLVLTCDATHARGPSELELRVSQLLAARAPEATPDAELVLLEEPPAGSPSTAIGFGALRSLLRLLHGFIAKRRALDARDLYPAEGEPPTGVDVDELHVRLNAGLRPALAGALAQLRAANDIASGPALRAALLAAAELGIADCVPDSLLDDEPSVRALQEQTGRALATLGALALTLQKRIADFKAPAESDPTFSLRMTQHYSECLRGVLGGAFPVLPMFRPVNAAELTASLTQQQSLTGGDSLAVLTWLQQLALVRPDLDGLSSVLTGAGLLGQTTPATELAVAQLPHVAGQRWAALSLPDPAPLLSLALLGRFDLEAPIAGLACDGWSELIPAAKETTGITFHYDAPAARAPQTILLATPAARGQAQWSFDALFDTIMETWQLSQLRAVGPKQIRVLTGNMLPTVYLPQDDSHQIPSVKLDAFVRTELDGAKRALGKASHVD